MRHLNARLFALALILLFSCLTYYNWHQLNAEGSYSTKLAAFAPVGLVGGIFLLLFPDKMGKPETAKDKIIVMLVFGTGLLVGLYNWYLMEPEFFGR